MPHGKRKARLMTNGLVSDFGLRKSDPVPVELGKWAEATQDFALVALSASSHVVWANGALERVLGYTPEELVGKTLACVFTPEDLARGLDDHEIDVARTTGRAEDDRWHIGKHGRRVYCHGVLTALRDGEGRTNGFVKIFRDRTDVRTQIETLENSLSEGLARAGRKDVFLSTLAHELRSPLQAIANAANLFRRATDPGQNGKVADIVERQTTAIARLIDDLLDATRIDAGRLRIRCEPVRLQDAIAETVGLFSGAVDARRLQLHVVVPDVPIVLEADPMRLGQILRNLIENAVKYTPPGGNVWVTATVEGEAAVTRVRDDGNGMSAEVLPRIFEMFTRDAKALDSATDGLGIGLSVVKSLVELHHGIIEVQSAGPSRGSTFTLNLPLRQPRYDDPTTLTDDRIVE